MSKQPGINQAAVFQKMIISRDKTCHLLVCRKRNAASICTHWLASLFLMIAIFTNTVSGLVRDIPWSGMERNDFVQLLIRWKVREKSTDDNYDGRNLEADDRDFSAAERITKTKKKRSFKELLKHKTSLLPGNHDLDEIHRRLDEADDSGVEVTVDIDTFGVTAVSGTVSYFEDLDLSNHIAIDLVELDQVVGIYEPAPKQKPSLTHSILTVSQYHDREPEGIGLVQASSIPPSHNITKACLVDTGYDDGHPDLPSSKIAGHSVEGFNHNYFVNSWNNDINGHGTLVAGVMFAVGDNKGIHGINADPKTVGVVMAKGIDDDGYSTTAKALKAVSECSKVEGIKVLNLSYGGTEYSTIENDFFEELYNSGKLIVAASGNSGIETKLYPASYSSVISVNSIDSDGSPSYFSHSNNQIEIAAPGNDVETTSSSSGATYEWATGTSLSAPHVSGILLKVWAHFPDCTNYQMRQAMLKTATLGQNCNESLGHGLVQGKLLYDKLKQYGCNYGGTKSQWKTIHSLPSKAAIGGCDENMNFILSVPTKDPTAFPTLTPTNSPTEHPTRIPTLSPTNSQTIPPSAVLPKQGYLTPNLTNKKKRLRKTKSPETRKQRIFKTKSPRTAKVKKTKIVKGN